jgi:hypothetical protein
MDSKSVGYVVFGVAMTVTGYLRYRFPRATYPWNKDRIPAWSPPWIRLVGGVSMLAGSVLVAAGILVVR